MSDKREVVTVVAGGSEFTGWETVQITAGIKDPVRSFSLTVAEAQGDWVLPPNMPVQILANGSLMLNGFVDVYNPQHNGGSATHHVSITGRGKGCDAVDCSAQHETGRFEDKDLLQIANELDVHGIGFTTNADLKTIDIAQLNPGEKTIGFLQELARSRKLNLMGKADGSIEIYKPQGARHAGALRLGINIQSGNANLSAHQKFSDYIGKGQNTLGVTEQELRPEAKVKDSTVSRYRPLTMTLNEEATPELLEERMRWEAKRRQGLSVKASITTQSWRDGAGIPWEPGFLVYTSDSILKIEQDMLIERCVWKHGSAPSDSHSSTELSLVDPKAYDGPDAGASESDGQWATGV
jgi:prophage tail gpP-like protein